MLDAFYFEILCRRLIRSLPPQTRKIIYNTCCFSEMPTKNNISASLALPENEPVARVFSQSSENVALVRTDAVDLVNSPGANKMLIQLLMAGKLVNFQRKSTDPISQVLSRMRISCASAIKVSMNVNSTQGRGSSPARKLQKSTGSEPVDQPEISFLDESNTVLSEGTLGEVVRKAVSVRIDSDNYMVVVDPPLAVSLHLETSLWCGFPVVASWAGTGAPLSEFVFVWEILDPETNQVLDSIEGGEVFTPRAGDAGNFLQVRCFHPKHPQFFLSTVSVDRIAEFKGKCARLAQPLPATNDDTIRVATFNILAQPYIRTALAQDAYYTHLHGCWQTTDWARRSPLIMREMLDSGADVFCLQEVAAGSHETQLQRLLGGSHDWHFFGKASVANNGNPIGVSISLRKSRFDLVSSHKFNLGQGEDSLLSSMLTEAERVEIEGKFGQSFFSTVLKGIHTIAGVVVARIRSSNQLVLVANTHLFFHPFGGHIRILQGLCFMRKLHAMRAELERETGQMPGLIVCGDFNSRPNSGSFEVMNSGVVEANNIDWQYGKAFRAEKVEDEEEGQETTVAPVGSLTDGFRLTHDLVIDHIPSQIPELTHATAAFRSTLDYIFYTKDVFAPVEGEGTGSAIPELTNAEVDGLGGLPASFYGSDHVLVAGDLKLAVGLVR